MAHKTPTTIMDQFGHTLYHAGEFLGKDMYVCPKCSVTRSLQTWRKLIAAHEQNTRCARGISSLLRRLADAV